MVTAYGPEVEKTYGVLFDSLKLDAGKRSAMASALSDRVALRRILLGPLLAKYTFDVSITYLGMQVMTMGTHGIDVIDKIRADEVEASIQPKFIEILGDDYPAFKKFDQDLGYMNDIKVVNISLSAENKFSSEQITKLIQLMEAAHPNGPPSYGYYNITDDVIVGASAFLNEAQMRQFLKRVAYNQDMVQAVAVKDKELVQKGWKGNPSKEPILITDPFR